MRILVRRLFTFSLLHWKKILLWGVCSAFIFGGIILLWAASLRIPDLDSIQNRKIEQSLKIYDRTGTVVLYDLNRNIDRVIVPLSDISQNIQNATIAMEDPNFYYNPGIEVTSIIRAVIKDILPGGVTQGGSTITQQVIKNTVLTNDKTITRKLKEWVLALKLTRILPKEKILELYLNQVPYGGHIYGAEEAAEQFFGVHASEVTLAQAAYMAAVLPAPTYYSPFGNHTDSLENRKNMVLEKMYEHGFITAKERDSAKQEKAIFQTPKTTSILSPHFVFYVEQYLEQKYGKDALEQSGWSIITTLDAELQTHAQETVEKNALTNTENFNASNAGLVAIDPKNGQILAMVGSRNYFDAQIDGNYNITLASRQPGSAFKPFAYAQALSEGYTPDTVLFDAPTQFSTNCSVDNLTSENGCYSPVNYDDKFRGPMTMRNALAQSINVPSVEVLYLAGINDTMRLAKSMGVALAGDANQYGLTLVLGGGEVTLLDMTSAYGTFAADGIHYAPTVVLQIKDREGNIIEDNSQPSGTRVLPQTVAQQINDILSDPIARAPLGENNLFTFPGHDIAVKTGTTNNFRDAWTIGYTPTIVIGVWAGNNDNTPMVKKVSGFIVGPMWSQVMRYALSTRPAVAFSRSDAGHDYTKKPVLRGIWQGGISQIVDAQTGAPASPSTPPQFIEERVVCDVHNILYWLDKNDLRGSPPLSASKDPQFPYWERAVERYVATHGACSPGSQVVVGGAPGYFQNSPIPTFTF